MKPSFSANNQSEGWLAVALTTFAALFGAVGIGTGDTPRVLRNHALPASITFAAVIAAGVCIAAAGWMVSDPPKEKKLIRLSTLALVIAAFGALWAGIASARERPEPAVTGQIVADAHGESVLRFGVKDSGLRSADRMTVAITAIPEVTGAQPPPTTLYAAALGPDSSGNVDHSGEVAIPPAPENNIELQAWVGRRHSCTDETIASTGCIKLHITRLFEKPQLTLTWDAPSRSSDGLKIAVSAHDLASHRVVLRVLDADSQQSLLEAHWPSDDVGDVEQTITATVPRSTKRLCVAASTTESSPSCTVPEGSGDATVLTTVPTE